MPSGDSTTWRVDRFLRRLILPSCVIALMVSAIGTLTTGSLGFALGCMVCAFADVFVVGRWSERDRAVSADLSVAAAMTLLTGRLAVRAAVLIAFAFLTPPAAFYGAVAGSLIYDAVLFSLGSVRAARSAFAVRSRKEEQAWKDYSTHRTSSS